MSTHRALWMGLLLLSQTVFGAEVPAEQQKVFEEGGVDSLAAAAMKLRDPFKLPLRVEETLRPLTELERYPLTDFVMLGVITGPKKVRAMIRDPKGQVHTVTLGDRIGTREGKIQLITESGISVEEKVVNVLGQEEHVVSQIQLPETK